jgi:peroxiredoxin (alkyl hydroperoxide reductase subunit C)
MLTVGDQFPEFDLKATVSDDLSTAFASVRNDSYPGQWLVTFFWPKDFTFVCPTEIAEFGRNNAAFVARGAQVLGASVDSEFVHLAWRRDHPDLRDLPFPMLADINKDLSRSLGILDDEGVAKRATFIIDPDGIIRFASVTDMNVGRNVDEVLRVLDALQTGALCACNWQPGDANLVAA